MKKGSSLLIPLLCGLVQVISGISASNISQNKESEIRSQWPKLLWDTYKESEEAGSKVRPADICGNLDRLSILRSRSVLRNCLIDPLKLL